MIVRIVKLTIQEDKIDVFMDTLSNVFPKIALFEGCMHLDMMQDIHNPKIFFTYSHWESENHLNVYRKSTVFGSFWPKIKKWFAQKPVAWSVEVLSSSKEILAQ